MTNTTDARIKDLTWNMSLDEKGTLWIGGDGLNNADNRRDANELIEMGVLREEFTMYGIRLYVNRGYEKFFERF